MLFVSRGIDNDWVGWGHGDGDGDGDGTESRWVCVDQNSRENERGCGPSRLLRLSLADVRGDRQQSRSGQARSVLWFAIVGGCGNLERCRES